MGSETITKRTNLYPDWGGLDGDGVGVGVNVGFGDIVRAVGDLSREHPRVVNVVLATGLAMGLAVSEYARVHAGVNLVEGPMWPIEMGDGPVSSLIEESVNHPVEAMWGIGVTGAVAGGGLRVLIRARAVWSQLTQPQAFLDREGTMRQSPPNLSDAAFGMGKWIAGSVVQEGFQYARLPALISAVYWMNVMADQLQSPEASVALRAGSLAVAGLTMISTIEALNPLT